ncbi:MAG: GumC domain-containing protein, partial [Planctomycetota bacterium]
MIPRLVFSTEENGLPRFFSLYLNTEVSRISSPIVLQRALDQPEVRNTNWYNQKPRTLRTVLGSPYPSHLERLKADLSVERQPNTELLDVKMVTVDAADAHVIVNAVIEVYMRYRAEVTSELEESRFRTLRNERKGLKSGIDDWMEYYGELSKRLGADDPDIVRAELVGQWGELEMERKRLERSYQMTQWALGERQSADGKGGASGDDSNLPDPILRYAADLEWRRLNNALQDTSHQLEMARRRYGESHPRIGTLKLSLEHRKGLLQQREVQLGTEWPGTLDSPIAEAGESLLLLDVGALAARAKKKARELEVLDQQIESVKREQDAKGDLAKEIAQIGDQLSRERKVYNQVEARLEALEMEQKAPGRISVASKAVAPAQPFRDRRFLLTAMALCGAMMT